VYAMPESTDRPAVRVGPGLSHRLGFAGHLLVDQGAWRWFGTMRRMRSLTIDP
jgi:hypothetical protein